MVGAVLPGIDSWGRGVIPIFALESHENRMFFTRVSMTKTTLSAACAALMFTAIFAVPVLSGGAAALADGTPVEKPFNPVTDTVDPDTGETFNAPPTRTQMANDAPTTYKLYVKAGGGYNYQDKQRYNGEAATFDGGLAVSGAIGYMFENNFRIEGEVNYHRNYIDRIKTAAGPYLAEPTGELSTTAFMLNGYYDIPTNMGIKPYVGGGIGYAMVEGTYENFSAEVEGISENVFAYQGIAGSNFEISDSFSLYAEYKYFATEDVNVEPAAANGNNVSHSILAGLKYNFY